MDRYEFTNLAIDCIKLKTHASINNTKVTEDNQNTDIDVQKIAEIILANAQHIDHIEDKSQKNVNAYVNNAIDIDQAVDSCHTISDQNKIIPQKLCDKFKLE